MNKMFFYNIYMASLIPSTIQDICGMYFISQTLRPGSLPNIGNMGGILQSIDLTTNRQGDVQQIIQNETNRLEQKKVLIDHAIQGQLRMVSLNESYRQKNAQYRQLIILACVALAIFIGMVYLNRNYSMIPDSLMTILTIALISIVVIYAASIFTDIQSRNNIYFDRLNLAPPSSFTDASGADVAKRTAAYNSGNLLGALPGLCSGGACCAPGTHWDASGMKCMPGP
jgi:hypothetical protein